MLRRSILSLSILSLPLALVTVAVAGSWWMFWRPRETPPVAAEAAVCEIAPGAAPPLRLKPVVGGFEAPVYITHAGDGSGRLFVVEKHGVVFTVEDGERLREPFLDISERVTTDGEEGLLSIAFHPDYAQNGRLFVFYSATGRPRSVVAEMRVSSDPNRVELGERVLLEIPQSEGVSIHKGGQLQFAPDGTLYISVGDAGDAAERRVQDLSYLHGKLLRIDVDDVGQGARYAIPDDNPFVGVEGARGEVYALGFRNPWRFSIDPCSERLFLGDVGEDRYEAVFEVTPGANYGWPLLEGGVCFAGAAPGQCGQERFAQPMFRYRHLDADPEGGNAVIGGYVYRGERHPDLQGRYLFTDSAVGRIWALSERQARDSAGAYTFYQHDKVFDEAMRFFTFGEDEAGELYTASVTTGFLYRIVAEEPLTRADKEALAANPDNPEARLLLAFEDYRAGRLELAERRFGSLLALTPTLPDVFYGLALVHAARDEPEQARRYALHAAQLDPEREDVQALLDNLAASPDGTHLPLLPYARPTETAIPFIAEDGFLRHADGRRILVKGVNLGLALPGRFPSEFPEDRALYREWLDWLGEMNANTVRLYTVVPPAFYEALRDYNLAHPASPIYLFQGLWTELPDDDDYGGAFEAAFLDNAYEKLDLLHGQAILPPRPGRASGRYTADVSPWLLGIIVGPEWLPSSIKGYEAQHEGDSGYEGRYLSAPDARPMEAWLAGVMDAISRYHTETYNQQTPIAFTNWPTLDPFFHPTESTHQEEDALRVARGEPPNPRALEARDNDDEVTVDPTAIRATEAFRAGHFASYHVYPYAPDFLNLDPTLQAHPVSSYQGYLERLHAHHGEQPLIISEFGVPSSRGVAHFQPQGYHHGSHNEQGQADLNVALYQQIIDSGAAGGVVFAWLDEWFKTNWLYLNLTAPLEHRPRWHSLMNPEENYGLIGTSDVLRFPLGTPPERWPDGVTQVAQTNDVTLSAYADASYLHVLVDVLADDGGDSPVGERVVLEFDTHPTPGATFKVVLTPDEGRMWVNAGYQLFKDYDADTPWAATYFDPNATPTPEAGWALWLTEPNRRRLGRDGSEYPRQLDEPGVLRPGHDPEGGFDVLADYTLGEHLHLRLPWTLLGVTDPSTRTLYDGSQEGLRVADDIGLKVMLEGVSLEGRYRWETWTEPSYTLRRKPAYYALQRLWAELE